MSPSRTRHRRSRLLIVDPPGGPGLFEHRNRPSRRTRKTRKHAISFGCPAKSGTGPFFGEQALFAVGRKAENMDLSPWQCRRGQCRRGQSHFRGDYGRFRGNAVFAAKIGTVPVNAYGTRRPFPFDTQGIQFQASSSSAQGSGQMRVSSKRAFRRGRFHVREHPAMKTLDDRNR